MDDTDEKDVVARAFCPTDDGPADPPIDIPDEILKIGRFDISLIGIEVDVITLLTGTASLSPVPIRELGMYMCMPVFTYADEFSIGLVHPPSLSIE